MKNVAARMTLALSLFFALTAPTYAMPQGAQKFTVLRNGDAIGSHVMNFRTEGDTTRIDIETNITVKILMLSVYHFEHEGHELWKNGRLVSLSSHTNDDGTRHNLEVRGTAETLDIKGDGKPWQRPAQPDAIPGSVWNRAVVNQSVILNTLDGSPMEVKVVDAGSEAISVHNSTEQAEHYILTGDLNRELWYNASGDLVRMRFAGQDKSVIDYVLQ
jgi:hypothetical protein